MEETGEIMDGAARAGFAALDAAVGANGALIAIWQDVAHNAGKPSARPGPAVLPVIELLSAPAGAASAPTDVETLRAEIGRATYEKNTDSLDATLAFARALNNGGMAEAALPLTRAVLQVDPTNPTALKLLIWNHLMVGDYPSALEAARLYLPTCPRDANTRWAVALAHVGSGDVEAAAWTARDAVAADPDDVTVWNLLGYLHRLGGDEAAAHDAWSTGLEHVAASAGGGDCHNPRVQSWLANVEACVGHAERAHARVARLTEAEPHNGYLKYRLTHVLAELGDAEAAIRTLREAVQDGFLSVQLLWHDERLGISNLVGLAEYRQVRRTLRQNVERVKNKYAPSA